MPILIREATNGQLVPRAVTKLFDSQDTPSSTNARLKAILLCAILLLCATLGQSQTSASSQQDYAAHLQSARSYLDDNRPNLAIPELQAAANINPDNAETQSNLGVLLYFQGRFADAIPHLRIALDKQPGLIKIQGLLGIAEARTQDFLNARKDMIASFAQIADKKFKVEVGLELVGLFTQNGDLDEASRAIAQLKRIDPNNREVLYAAYCTYAAMTEESMTALAQAAPDSAQMHQLLAHEEITEGNTSEAIAQYRKAITINSHLPGVHYELAELLNILQDKDAKEEAEKEFRAALAANSRDEKAECKLGEIEASRGNTKLAYAHFLKAVELQPGDPDAKLGLAKVLIQMNQPGTAQELLKQAIQLDPENAAAHYRLAALYRKDGRMADAKREADLYKQYRNVQEKLHATFKVLIKQPGEIHVDE